MNANWWKNLICAGCLSLGGLTLVAGPLQRTDLPAAPAWLAHLDVDGLRPTAIGQYLLSEMDQPRAKARLAAFQAMFDLDLRTQVYGVTLYGLSARPEEGVMLVYGDFSADRLITLAKAAHDSQNTAYKQHVIYNWIDDKKKAKNGVKPRVYAALEGHRVIFGQQEKTVAQALDVLDGAAPSLAAGQAFAQMGTVGDTSFLEGAVSKLDLPQATPNADILRLSKLVRLQVGAVDQHISSTLVLEADTEEVATQISSVIQGLIALMKMQSAKPETVALAQGLSLKQEGSSVVVSGAFPGSQVVEMMKADAARKAASKAQGN